jgi:hypothetical protein
MEGTMTTRSVSFFLTVAALLAGSSAVEAQAPVGIRVAVDAGGIQEVRTTFASVDALNDVGLASLTEGSVLTLTIDSPVSVAALIGVRRALEARGVEDIAIGGVRDQPTQVRLTPGGGLLVTVDGSGLEAGLPSAAFLRAIVPNNPVVVVPPRGPLAVSVLFDASRVFEELGAESVQFGRP